MPRFYEIYLRLKLNFYGLSQLILLLPFGGIKPYFRGPLNIHHRKSIWPTAGFNQQEAGLPTMAGKHLQPSMWQTVVFESTLVLWLLKMRCGPDSGGVIDVGAAAIACLAIRALAQAQQAFNASSFVNGGASNNLAWNCGDLYAQDQSHVSLSIVETSMP